MQRRWLDLKKDLSFQKYIVLIVKAKVDASPYYG